MLDFDRFRPAAGRYAEQRYRTARQRWRERVVRPYRWIFLLIGGGIFAAEMATRPSLLDWTLGLAMGGLIGLWVTFWDSPPPYVENWRRGADGERRTERVLRGLKRHGWRFAHDIEVERGNRDHVAIGPGGVYLLETKRPHGEVSIDGDRVHVAWIDDADSTGYEMPRLAWRVRAEAASLSDELGRATGQRCWVQAVVVIWAPFPHGVVESNRVVYVHGLELRRWLASRRATLTAGQCVRLAQAVSTAGAARLHARSPANDS
jgi:hypothetical protein